MDQSESDSSEPVIPEDAPEWSMAGITFASELDAARYHSLQARLQELQAQMHAAEREMEQILSRAHWSIDAILDREG